jgi:glycosyltransferase involved in cell wall biosynthesis
MMLMETAERRIHSPQTPGPGACPLTVAIPVYNEEQILVANTRTLIAYLDGLGIEYQVLIGSNGSTDSTPRLALELQHSHPRVEAFHLRDRGVGLAFREFVRRARYPFLVSLDMDLSADLAFVRAAVELAGSHDIVVGSKKLATQRRSMVRKLGSDTFLWFARRLTGLPYDDYSIGAKGYNVAFLREHETSIDAGSSYVLDLCLLAARNGGRVACVPVACEDRRTSKFSLPREGIYKFVRLFRLSAWDIAGRGIVSEPQQATRSEGSGIGAAAARIGSLVTGTKVRS